MLKDFLLLATAAQRLKRRSNITKMSKNVKLQRIPAKAGQLDRFMERVESLMSNSQLQWQDVPMQRGPRRRLQCESVSFSCAVLPVVELTKSPR